MIKVILFDLDGVLIEAKHLHYVALNDALDVYGYKITRLEHLKTYDGRPTKAKLKMLTENKNLPEEYHKHIWKLKQNLTYHLINNEIKPRRHITEMLQKLSKKYRLGMCSNSIRRSCDKFLECADIIKYFEKTWSNEDVTNPKPNSDIYIDAMKWFGVLPHEVMIVEDSPIGLQAAYDSKANVCPVKNTLDCTFRKIKNKIIEVEKNDDINYTDGW